MRFKIKLQEVETNKRMTSFDKKNKKCFLFGRKEILVLSSLIIAAVFYRVAPIDSIKFSELTAMKIALRRIKTKTKNWEHRKVV